MAVRFAMTLFVYGLIIAASARAGAPDRLPEVAMGWDLLFHVERASILAAALGAVAVIGWRASRGDFPVRFGQIEYAVREAAADVEVRNETLEGRLRTLEELMDVRHTSAAKEESA